MRLKPPAPPDAIGCGQDARVPSPKAGCPRSTVKKMKDQMYSELLKACAQPGCPLCRMSLEAVRRYLASTMYEFVNDGGVRAALRAARGYCNRHAWMVTEGYGVVLGVAVVQRDLIDATLEATESVPQRQGGPKIARRLRPTADCPACTHQRRMDDIAIQTLLKYLDDPDMASALEGTCLCLPHLARALELVQNSDQLELLLRFQRKSLLELRGELSELIRKHDYRFVDEGFGPEGDSWLRATGIVSGERGAR